MIRALMAVLLVLAGGAVRAGHYAGGSITWDCLGAGQYQINLDLFLDCSGFTIIPQDITFTSDCGTTFTVEDLQPVSQQEVSQLCAAQLASSTCNGGALPGITWYRFTTVQNLPPCDSWNVSWNICCRSNSINLTGNQGMFIDAQINTLDAPCDDSPVFTDQSLPYVCVDQPVYYNFGVNEPDGNTLVYSLISGQYFNGTNEQPLVYQPGFSGAFPVPGITVDPITGQIAFTPSAIGNYVVVMEVAEYDGLGNLIGTVMRDITFVVIACTGNVPQTQGVVNNTAGILTSPSSIEVCDGQAFCVDVQFTDADPGTILQVVSQATALLPGATFNVLGTNPATAHICWTGDVNYSPVNVLVQADDGNCPIENTASLAINIISVAGGGPPPSPGTNGSVQICPGANAFFLVSVLGGTPDVNGFWTGPDGAAHNSEFNPLLDPPGVYTYTTGNACAFATATATISFAAAPDAGTDGTLTVCSDAAPSDLFSSLGGTPSMSGSWTMPGGASFSGTYDPTVNTPGAYVYTVVGGGGCPGASATVTVTEITAPEAGTDGAATFCTNGGAQNLIGFLGGTPQLGGIWTDPLGAVFGGSYNPALHGPGTYTYTVVGGAPCGNASAVVQVTENALPDPGTSGVFSVCSNAAAFDLPDHLGGSPDAGGVWTAPGGGPHSTVYDPAIDVPGVYTYAVTGTAPCPSAAATVTVSENLAPDAGTDGTLNACSSGVPVNLFDQLIGAQSNGTWELPDGTPFTGVYDPAVHGPGIYTYSVPGLPPCALDQAIVTVSESAAPYAGADATSSVCANNLPTNLFPLIVGAPAGGAWTGPGGTPFTGVYDPLVHAPGTYTYTVAGVAPCPSDAATVTITESDPPFAGNDASITLCDQDAPEDLFLLLGGGADGGGFWTPPAGQPPFNGIYDPSTSIAGSYMYTVAGVAPCPFDVSTVTVSVVQQPYAGADTDLALCGNSAPTALIGVLTGADPGGAWTAPGGGVFGGTYDPALQAPGNYTYLLPATAPCVAAQAVVTVTESAAPFAGTDGAVTFCADAAPTALLPSLAGAGAGGAWTGPGGTPHSGVYDPAVDGPGVYTYTLTGTPPCVSDQAVVTVTVNATPWAGTDGALDICSDAATVALFGMLGGTPDAGGTWTTPGGGAFGGTFDPAIDAPGPYVYTVNGIAPCGSDQSVVLVTIHAAPNAGVAGPLALCGDSPPTPLFSLLVGADAGGAWTTPGGGAFNGSYDPATDGPGDFTYTVQGAPACGSDQAIVSVSEDPPPFAGVDADLVICGSAPAALMLPLLGGADPGGSWTAPGGGAHSGSYDPAVDGPGVYVYTVSGSSACTNDMAAITVTEDVPSAATVGYAQPALCSSAGPIAVNLIGSTGGVFSAVPAGLALDALSGTIDPGTSDAGAYTITYALPATGVCPAMTTTADISIAMAPDAGTDAALTVCDAGAPTALFALLGGAQVGGSWTVPGGGAFTGTYDPATHAPGVYTYTVVGTSPCPDAQAAVTVTETGSPDAGTDGLLTICSDGTSVGLLTALTGADPGGSWTAPGGGPHTGLVDPAVDAQGVYVYTLAAMAPCLGDQSEVTVTITPAPVAGTDGSVTVCDSGAPVVLLGVLSGAQPGGSWTGPGGAVFSGTYDPASDVSGPYTYTLVGAPPCMAAQAVVTVTETGSPQAGADGTITVCSNGATTGLFAALNGADPGGTWTAPGGAVHSGSFDPGTDPVGVYTYTLSATPPCTGDQSQVTVTVQAAPDAGNDGALTVCDLGGASALFTALTGADAGGVWTAPGGGAHSGSFDPTTDAPGIYTYTVIGVSPCATDQAAVSVTTTGSPDAGTDGALTLCSTGVPTGLFAALNGADPGGTWTAPGGAVHSGSFDPGIDPPGVYTYTLTAAPPCAGDQSQVTVTIQAAPEAGNDGALTVCDQGGASALFAALTGADAGGFWTAPGGGAHSGSFDPATDASGIYTYTVNGMAPCVADEAEVTVTVTGSPDAGTDGVLSLCANGLPTMLFGALGGADAGGTWTAPGGAAHSGTLDPLLDGAGTYTYTIAALAPCTSDQATVTVGIQQPPQAGVDGALTVCDQGAPGALLAALTGADAGGTWTAPGGGPHSGSYDPAMDPEGDYTYTVSGMAPCPSDQAVVTVQETGSPQAGADGTLTLCASSGTFDLFSALTGADPGGAWIGPDGMPHASIIDPGTDMAGQYTYMLAATPPCTGDQSQVLVTLVAPPDPGADAAAVLCDMGQPVDLFTELSGAEAGGTWTSPGGGAHSGTYDPITDAPGDYTYTVAGTAPCVMAQAVVTVTETSAPDAGTSTVLDLCSTAGPVSLLVQLEGADPGGSWTGPGGAPHSGTFVPALDTPGDHTYTIAGTAPCPSASAVVTVQVEAAPDAGVDGGFTVCSGDAPFDLLVLLGGTPDPDGTWSDVLNAPFNGVFDPAVSIPGMYTYTVAGVVCPSDLATVLVNTVPGPNAGQDNAIAFCATDAPADLFGMLLGQPDQTGTWMDPDGQPFFGTLDPATAIPGNYTYTVATIAGACPDASATVHVTVNAPVNAGTVGNLALCSTSGPVSLITGLGGSPDPGGVWTDPLGTPFSGTFDPASAQPGVYTYTMQGAAPCPDASASINVELNAQPDAGQNVSIATCDQDAPFPLFAQLGGNPDAGGTWTLPDGGTGNGQFIPGSSTSGNYTYTLLGVSPCVNDQATITIAVSEGVQAGANASISVCADADPFVLFPLLGSGADAGGTWTAPGGGSWNGSIDPSSGTSGDYVYTVVAPAPCPVRMATVTVTINDVPSPLIVAEMADGCAPVEVTFSNANGDEGTYAWDFGNGQAGVDGAPEPVLYGESGHFEVALTVTSPAGCIGGTVLVGGIDVYARPEAAFSHGPDRLNSNAPEAFFQNASTGANAYEWDFAGLGTSTETNPSFTFPDGVEGVYTICLTAFASENCFDTACAEVRVPLGAGLFVPDAFTPNGDGVNDVFTPIVNGVLEEGYRFMVFDRWGLEIFSTERPGTGWNGELDGMEAPVDVYVWKVTGRERYGTGHVDRMGHVTLMR